MAAAKKAPSKKKETIEEELEDLEDLEDLEEEEPEEDEDEDEESEDDDADDEEEDDEDEEDTPPKKTAKKAKKPKKRDDGKIGSAELAAALGTSGRELRVMLRQKKVEKADSGRYEWDDVESAVEEMGFKSIASAKKGLAASRATRLEELKERVADKKKKAPASKKAKSKKAPVEDDSEDDEEDDDE